MTTYLILAWLGAAAGSFVGAFTWRLKTRRNFVTGRSQCEHCHHVLGAADLVPVVSWLVLRGRCRYCKKPIGWTPLVLEIGMAALFALSFAVWPMPLDSWQAWVSLVLWYVYLVALASLAVSDLRWMILPDVIVFPLIAFGLADAALRYSLLPDASLPGYLWRVLSGAAALGGTYWLLHRVSDGRWVGLGDVKLGVFIGVVLGWQQALLALFLANFIGFLCVLPGLLSGRLSRKAEVPFGQFLIAGFLIAGLFGQRIIDHYLQATGL